MEANRCPRVLFVEDEESIRLPMSEALRDAGFHVLEACTAREALDVLADPAEVDLLFTDVRMPGDLDGVDLAMRARHRFPHMKLVIVSGYAVQLGQRLGAFQPPVLFIPKPYGLEQVAMKLRNLLSGTPSNTLS